MLLRDSRIKKPKILSVPHRIMTLFVQRLGLRTAPEQALQNPLAWSPLPVAAVSQGPDWGISSQAYIIGYTDSQQPRQSPEKGNSLVSHELPTCPSHTEVQWGQTLNVSTQRTGGSLPYRCRAYRTPAQGPRTIWLCVLVCSIANIPRSYQHLLKPVPISFLA